MKLKTTLQYLSITVGKLLAGLLLVHVLIQTAPQSGAARACDLTNLQGASAPYLV